MNKQITIKNIQYDVDTKEYIEQPSLGTVIKSLGLPNDAATYKAFITAIGEELKQERQDFWIDVIENNQDTQTIIEEYLQKRGILYGVNKKVGIQLGYITTWAESKGLVQSNKEKIENLHYLLTLENANTVDEIAKSGFTPSTLLQYLPRYKPDYDMNVYNKIKALGIKSRLTTKQQLVELRKEIAELKEAITELQKTR